MENWKKENFENGFSTLKEFNGCKYKITIYVDKTDKSIKFWAGVSSGKKKKDLEVFVHKEEKSIGGIKSLLWIKTAILSFPEWYNELDSSKRQYLCIAWSDNRRRNIYKRLEKEGFIFMIEDGKKILMKKL